MLSPSEKYLELIESITNAIKIATSSKKSFNYVNKNKCKNPVPWWDSECDKLIRLRRANFKKYEITKKLNDLINYKKHASMVKKILKTKKVMF